MGLNTSVTIGRLKLKNPVMAASGTFGTGEEYTDFIDVNRLGAIVTKTITLDKRAGNPPPRVVETASGMLNSIGLENNGAEYFIKHNLPALKKLRIPYIVSIGGESADEIAELAKRLNKVKIGALEINISCPNIKKAKGLIAQDRDATYELVNRIRRITKAVLITKLSPNVTDITEIAKAAQAAGSDAVSLINTLIGMAVDIETKQPRLGAITGGLSGPAIKPVALRMVREVYNKVKIPVIGIGGIMDYRDALEFIICGATAVQVGTVNFINPEATIEIIDGMEAYLKRNKISSLKNLIGKLKT
jgi:dihydroorotate dehydrogenase (NAD+) catalytic subunit